MKKSVIGIFASIISVTLILAVVFVIMGKNNSNERGKTNGRKTEETRHSTTKTTNKTTENTVTTFTITYELDGGKNNISNPNTFTNESNIVLKDAVKEGYNFLGWYLESDYKTKITNIDSTFNENIKLYAKFEEIVITYDNTITYHLDGGTNNPDNPSGFNDDETFTLLNPTKDGYDFKGWYTTDSYNTKIEKIEYNFDYELYALFEIHNYIITYYNVEGLTNQNPSFYTKFDENITLKNVNKVDYNFYGWYTTSTFDESSKITVIDTTKLTDYNLYAKLVEKNSPIVSVTNNNRTFDNTFKDLVIVNEIENGTLYFSLDNEIFTTTIPTERLAGTYTIYYKVVGDEGYKDIAVSSITTTISPAEITDIEIIGYSGYEDEASHNIVASKKATTVGGMYVSYMFSKTGTSNWVSEILVSEASESGTYWCTISAANHIQTLRSFTVTILPKNEATLSITNIDDFTRVYDKTTITPDIDTNSNGIITIEYYNGDTKLDCQPLNAGTYTIKVTVSSTVEYIEKTITEEFTISKKELTLNNITISDKPYDGTTDATISNYGSLVGVVLGDDVTLNTSNIIAVFASSNAASDITVNISGIAISGEESSNYSISSTATTVANIEKADSTLVPPTAKDLTYTGEAYVLINEGSSTGGTLEYSLDGTNYSATIPTATNAGTYTIYFKVLETENYNGIDADFINVEIKKATLNVVVTGYSGYYDGESHNIVKSKTASTVVDGTTEISWDYSTSEDGPWVASIEVSEVNKYTFYYKASAANHTDKIGSFEVEIHNKLVGTVTVTNTDSLSKIYDGTPIVDPSIDKNESDGIISVLYIKDEVSSSTKPVNAGTYTLYVEISETDTYAKGTFTYQFTISPKELTLTDVSVNSKAYDGNNSATISNYGTLSGIVPGDDVVLDTTNITATFASSNADNDITVSISGIALSGEDANNYTISSSATTTANVNKATIDFDSIEFNNATYTYDGENKYIYVSNTLPFGITDVSYTNNEGHKNVGEYEIIATFEYDSANFNAIGTKKAKLTIEKATPTTTGVTVNYDEGIGSFFSTNKTTTSLTFNGTFIVGDVTIPGTISYSDVRENLEIGSSLYSYTFTPTDSVNYKTVTGTCEIVVKATVKYYDDSTLKNTLYVAKNGTATNLPLDSKLGYTSDGWTLYNSETLYDFTTLVTTDLNLYTKYTIETYSITYVVYGGSKGSNPYTSYNVNTETITLNDASKDDCIFMGWFTNESFSENSRITAITNGSTGDITLYAKFIEDNSVKITYHLNGGTNSNNNPKLILPEDDSFTLENPTKGNAYTFAGWYLDSEFHQRIITIVPSEMTSDFDLYAKWTALQYSIIYYDGTDVISSLTPKTYTIEDSITLPTYNKFNHTFGGWYTDSSLTNSISKINVGTTGTIKLYAKTTDNGFTVKFYDTDKSTLLKTQTTSTYGSVTAPSYSYDSATYILKWVDNNGDEIDLTNIDSNYNLHAQLIVITYNATIYYVDADGYAKAKTTSNYLTTSTSNSLTYGASINLTRQMRITNTSTYSLFYMSPVSVFDWSMVVNSISTGTVFTNVDGTMSCYVSISGSTGTLSIFVYCIQPVAIITSSSQTLAYSENLNMSTSTYQFYKTVDEAFAALASSSSKLLRVYGRKNGTLDSNSLPYLSNTTINSVSLTINEITVARPKLVYSGSDVVLHNSYTISSGSIILPYSETCTDTTGYKVKNTAASSAAKVNSLMIIDEGVTLTISTTLTVGADIYSGSSIAGKGVLVNNGTIILQSSGTINSYGFLKGTGNVEIKSGATLVDYFAIYDWPGGQNGYGLYKKKVFSFQVYSFHNVSCKTRIYSGATYKAWYQLYMASTFVADNITLVGSGGLFQLSNGYIDKSVEDTTTTTNVNTNYTSSNVDRTIRDILDIHGDFSDNSISITIKVSLVSQTISTSTILALPIGFMKIKVSEGTGTLAKNSYKFLPGAGLYIGEKGKITINSGVNIIFYDEYPDDYTYKDESSNTHSGLTNTYSYQTKHSAIYSNGSVIDGYHPILMVDGTLDVKGNLGGNIYTSGTTGTIMFSNTSASLSKVLTLTYKSSILNPGSDCTTTSETVNARIYLYNSGSFAWTNATNTTYNSVESNGEFGWVKNTNTSSYTITYYVSSDSQTTSTVHTFESSYTITEYDLPVVEKEGYTFDTWYIDNSFNTQALGQSISSNTTLYAKFNPITYSINYHITIVDEFDESYQLVNNSPTYFTVENTTILTPATFGDMNFSGWYVDENYTVSAPNITSATFPYYEMIIDENNTINLYGYFTA